MRKNKTLRERQPATIWARLLREAYTGNALETRGASLAKHADLLGRSIGSVAKDAAALEAIDLDVSDVSDVVLAHAYRLQRRWETEFFARVEELFPTRPPVTTIETGPAEQPEEEEEEEVVVVEAPVPKAKKIWGHAATSIVRWMGAHNWTEKQASKCLQWQGIELSSTTIKIQLRAGLKAERGGPAALTSMQEDLLNDFLNQ